MNLVVDIGNTRLKWACADGTQLVESGSCGHADDARGPLLDLPAASGRALERVLVANVAGKAVEARVLEEVRSRFSLEAELVAPSTAAFGVRAAYADIGRLGVDRWVAMIAAHAGAPGGVCVISAGTAATFDAVAEDGAHLGGLILPGPRLMAEALEHNTGRIGPTQLAQRRPRGIDVLGRSTDEAVGHAALLAIGAAFDRAIAIAETAMARPPTVLLTGGDAALVRPWLESNVQLRADLVLEGLAVIAAADE